jgi:hypothetical protein
MRSRSKRRGLHTGYSQSFWPKHYRSRRTYAPTITGTVRTAHTQSRFAERIPRTGESRRPCRASVLALSIYRLVSPRSPWPFRKPEPIARMAGEPCDKSSFFRLEAVIQVQSQKAVAMRIPSAMLDATIRLSAIDAKTVGHHSPRLKNHEQRLDPPPNTG